MHPDINPAVEAQAIDWVIRQRDADFADWDAFAAWLVEDSAHAAVYDAVASLDVDLASLPRPAPLAFVQDRPRGQMLPRRAWFGGAVAAALVGAISLSIFRPDGAVTRVETAAGEHRTLTLADGSRIEVNGASVVKLDKNRPRFAQLDAGEAMFHIIHQEGNPFIVEAGDSKLQDMGTAFNVVRREQSMSVAVSEGVIVFNPGRQNIRVAAGKAIDTSNGVMHDIDVASVGGWRTGQLVYDGASLTEVAQDLNRTAGMRVTIAPDVARISFRGVLNVGKDPDRTIADLTALAGVRVEKQPQGWLLTQ